MANLLLDYANNNNIKLELKENILDNIILEYHKEKKDCINNISDINSDIIRLLDINRKNNNLKIVFNTNDTVIDCKKGHFQKDLKKFPNQ